MPPPLNLLDGHPLGLKGVGQREGVVVGPLHKTLFLRRAKAADEVPVVHDAVGGGVLVGCGRPLVCLPPPLGAGRSITKAARVPAGLFASHARRESTEDGGVTGPRPPSRHNKLIHLLPPNVWLDGLNAVGAATNLSARRPSWLDARPPEARTSARGEGLGAQ